MQWVFNTQQVRRRKNESHKIAVTPNLMCCVHKVKLVCAHLSNGIYSIFIIIRELRIHLFETHFFHYSSTCTTRTHIHSRSKARYDVNDSVSRNARAKLKTKLRLIFENFSPNNSNNKRFFGEEKSFVEIQSFKNRIDFQTEWKSYFLKNARCTDKREVRCVFC